jgi:hypothetical protein
MDAFELGLSSHIPGSPPTFEDVLHNTSESQLSTFIDPLHALSVVMYYLVNNFENTTEMSALMYWFARQFPRHLLETFLRLDSPTVRESWSKLLDWAWFLEEKSFFQILTKALMEDSQWIEWHGARVLVTAAWLDCHEICELLIHRGISPNQTCKFPPRGLSESYVFGQHKPRTASTYHSYISYKKNFATH